MNKRKFVELTIEKKKEVIDRLSNGISCRKIAEEFGISKSTVSNINSNRILILKAWEQNCNAKRKRLCKTPNDEVNEKVFQFFRICRSKNIPISGPLLQEKAREVAKQLQMSDTFVASNGWLESFRKRNNITFNVLCGESSDVNFQEAEDWKRKLPDIISKFTAENIFNADETGFYYRQLPSRSLIEKGKTCKGGKKAKERITVLLCCSAQGEKLKPLVIGNAANPRIFKKKNVVISNLPVIWKSNKRAWMTTEIFSAWLKEINLKMKRAGRKILLFIDNATSHVNLNLSNVTVQFLPPNLTSEVQPLDKGIIQSVKLLYRKQLMRALINSADTCNNVTEFAKSVSILDAIRWIHGAWKDISQETISKCFKHAGFLLGSEEEKENVTQEVDFTDEIKCLPDVFRSEFLDNNVLGNFDNQLEVQDHTPDSIEGVMKKIMGSSTDEQNENISSDESETSDVTEPPPTHERAIKCIDELENYAFAHQPELIDTFFGLRRKIESQRILSTINRSKQCLLTDFFNKP